MESTTLVLTPAPRQPSGGFTLLEMLVSLGIILVITAVVLLGQSGFNRTLVLVDTAYSIAFTLRQAQSFGLSSRVFGTTQNAGYGLHLANGVTTAYSLFIDIGPGNTQGGLCPGHVAVSGIEAKPGNCLYDSSAEQVTGYVLNRGFRISSFCGMEGAVKRCSGEYLDSLDITFLRPSTQPTILGTHAGIPVGLSSATIQVTSPDGLQERCVQVSKVGQIGVDVCS